jgi:hypothetical protein
VRRCRLLTPHHRKAPGRPESNRYRRAGQASILPDPGEEAHARVEFAAVNGQTGALVLGPGGVQAVVSLEIDDDIRVAAIFMIANPEMPPDVPLYLRQAAPRVPPAPIAGNCGH